VQAGDHPIINSATRLIPFLEFLVLAIEASAFGRKRAIAFVLLGSTALLAPNDGHGFSSFSAIGRSAFVSTRLVRRPHSPGMMI
jgi:hypothetical protein